MKYIIQAYLSSGDLSYTLVVDNEKDMIQAVKDAIYDGFAVLVTPGTPKQEL